MNQLDIMRSLLKKFRFEEPVPSDVRDILRVARKETLFEIFRRYRKRSIYVVMVMNVFFSVRRFGISISVAKSMIVVTVGTVISAALISFGSYYMINRFLEESPRADETVSAVAPLSNVTMVRSDKRAERKETDIRSDPNVRYSLGVIPFQSAKEYRAAGKIVNSTIFRELLLKKGKGKVVFVTGPSVRKQSDNLVMGSVIQIGGSYRISARLVEAKSSRILSYVTESAGNENDIGPACKRIAGKIAPLIK